MDFSIDLETQEKARATRQFCEKHIDPYVANWDSGETIATSVFEQMAALGLMSLRIPSENGGESASFLECGSLVYEVGRADVGLALMVVNGVFFGEIMGLMTEPTRSRWAPRVAAGAPFAITLTEPDAGSDAASIRTTAVRDGDHYIVNGSKMWITNARYANPLPTLVKTDPNTTPAHKGMSVLLVEATLPGFSVSRDIPKIGYKGTESCEVVFDNVKVPVECLLGGIEGRGMQQVLSALETGRINVAARALGVAQASYDKALSYSKQREAFGQPISAFQAIQLKLADMATEIQASRLLTYWAASKLDRGERADLESSMAKLFASEVALKASLESMRIHGGYGYSSEFEVERYYRDAPLMAIGEGTSDILRMVIAKQLLAGAELS